MSSDSKWGERFCIYGFCIDYPHNWKVSFNQNSEWKNGDAIFALDSETKVFLSWRPLKQMKEKYSDLNEHAQATISRIKKGSKTKNVNLISQEAPAINSHESISCCVGLQLPTRMSNLLRGNRSPDRNICFMHIYCEPSERHFLLYGQTVPTEFSELPTVIRRMAKSLKCH